MNFIIRHYRKTVDNFNTLIKQDLSAPKMSKAVAWGLFLGIIPFFCGVNIMLSALVCWRFKLNHLLVQLVNNVVYPLQLILFVPFIKIGVKWFSSSEMVFSSNLILSIFKDNVWDGICLLGSWNLYGLLAWLILGVPSGIVVYFISLKLFERFRDSDDEQNSYESELNESEEELEACPVMNY
jgi:uncharacterized protein (DUF2062 family)